MLSTKRFTQILVSLSLLLSGLLSAHTADAVSGYRVRGTGGVGLREHQAPRLSSAVNGTLGEGASLDIVCQTTGDSVHGSAIWDRLSDGDYVSDWYTSTPVVGDYSPGLPQCEAMQESAPASHFYRIVGTGQYGSLNVRSGPGRAFASLRRLREGDTVNLACQTMGSNVRGSTVWDRLRDGGYVSDFYVNTPFLGSYTPGIDVCSESPEQLPAPSVQTAALSRAESVLGSTNYLGLCDRFVAVAYGRSHSGYATAAEHLRALDAAGLVHFGDSNAPLGALVFYYAGPSNGWAGHVALSTGDGRAVSSEHWVGSRRQGVGYIDYDTTRNFGTYAGWAMPPSSWTG